MVLDFTFFISITSLKKWYEVKLCQIRQFAERFWELSNLIVLEVKLCQIGQLPDRFWELGNLSTEQGKLFQIGQLSEIFWDGGNRIVIEVKYF